MIDAQLSLPGFVEADPSAAPKLPHEKWPRLSMSLPGPRDRNHCQACGALGDIGCDYEPSAMDVAMCRPVPPATLELWQECDDRDQPTGGVYVVLCPYCAHRLIEPHPRLYERLDRFQPAPGLTRLCRDCPHYRNPLRCGSPLARFNGGPGFAIEAPHTSGFVCSRGKGGGRRSGMFLYYHGPAKACGGRGDLSSEGKSLIAPVRTDREGCEGRE